MGSAAEVFWLVFYLLGTPVGLVLLGLIAPLILATAYLVKRPGG